MYEVLQRKSIKDSLECSPYFLGITFGSALWVAYAWTTRLRHGVLLDAPTVCSVLIFIHTLDQMLPTVHTCMPHLYSRLFFSCSLSSA